jgi:hypothetical protein
MSAAMQASPVEHRVVVVEADYDQVHVVNECSHWLTVGHVAPRCDLDRLHLAPRLCIRIWSDSSPLSLAPRLLKDSRNRCDADSGDRLVTDIFGGSTMSGSNACIAALIESAWPWFCVASPSVVGHTSAGS